MCADLITAAKNVQTVLLAESTDDCVFSNEQKY